MEHRGLLMHEIPLALRFICYENSHSHAADCPTALMALFLLVPRPVFTFAHAYTPKRCSSPCFVRHVYPNCLSCCFCSYQVILLFSLVAIFQDFVVLEWYWGGLFYVKGRSSVPAFLPTPIFVIYLKELFWEEPGNFMSLFFSQALPSHDLLPSHYITLWILTPTLINKTARCRPHNTRSNQVLFTQLIKCILELILRIGRSFVLSGDGLSTLPFGYCSANSFSYGNPAVPTGSCLDFSALDSSSIEDQTDYPSQGCFLALGALWKIIACLLFWPAHSLSGLLCLPGVALV